MDAGVLRNIEAHARAIAAVLEWDDPFVMELVYQLGGIRTAMNVLRCCCEARGYEEISEICGIHKTSVSQVLHALERGGLNFVKSESGQWRFAPEEPKKIGRKKS